MTTKRYYEEMAKEIERTMARTDISEERKWMLGCTKERLEEYRNLAENEPDGIRM